MVLGGQLPGRVDGRRNSIFLLSGCGAAWLARLIWDQEVAGSNPVTPSLTICYGGYGAVG